METAERHRGIDIIPGQLVLAHQSGFTVQKRKEGLFVRADGLPHRIQGLALDAVVAQRFRQEILILVRLKISQPETLQVVQRIGECRCKGSPGFFPFSEYFFADVRIGIGIHPVHRLAGG
ncbi:hypothetical protein SDC9_129115 [bioreactor metagenome]|uniref:Uncharacterized protein n=1 Tax=bioreactor metagenome TaxID=1076179 RepID=A0A645CYR1_9ZZZZ